MMRKHLMILAVTLLSVISIGCATMPTPKQPAQEVAKYVANFDYTPSTQAVPGSAGVTFAVKDVAYQANAKDTPPWFMHPQLANFNDAIERDLSELLTAKGFSVRGPFDSYDLISFQDKKAIDLYLVPTFELLFTLRDSKLQRKFRTSSDYDATGTIEVNGKITLELREIVTRELMWAKSIPYKFEFSYSLLVENLVTARPFDFSGVMNDVAKELEKQYPELMATIFKLIDPEEMRIIKKQCQELKSKKGY